jgi:hypothetical protein
LPGSVKLDEHRANPPGVWTAGAFVVYEYSHTVAWTSFEVEDANMRIGRVRRCCACHFGRYARHQARLRVGTCSSHQQCGGHTSLLHVSASDDNLVSRGLYLGSHLQASTVFVSISELSARVSPTSHIRLSTMRTPTLQRLACRSPSTLVGQVSVDAHARLSDATTVVSCVTNAPAEPIKCLGVTWPCSQTNFKRGYQQVYLI